MSTMKKLVVFTGAGISAESGLKTFRDEDGLWMGYDINKVATPDAWKADRKLVQQFYNMRRNEVAKALPNAAHVAIANLQSKYHVQVITQNIDDLHERAGSKDVIHLHGEIFKMKSDRDETMMREVRGDIAGDAKAPDGGFWRPHVVWFGEPVPEMSNAERELTDADIFIVVGTSLQVYPAAGLLYALPQGIPKYLVDKDPPEISRVDNLTVIAKTASEGMLDLLERL